ncbi:MAG: DUF7916 family protein [Candidatus Asgardarchaeia archaeon]
MVKRLLTSSPKEILAMSKKELLEAIKMSEGRTIVVAARVRAPNLVDYVSNAELAAAFGADIVLVDTYNVQIPYVPGLPSKDPKEDEEIRDLIQVPLGKGWTLKELREIIGRPVGILLIVAKGMEKGARAHYGGILANVENARKAVEMGADVLAVSGWEGVLESIKEISKEVGDEAIIWSGRVHGPGLMGYIGREGKKLFTPEEAVELISAGADVIGFPAPGTFPGWDVEYASKIVDAVHDHGALASAGLHTSQEGSDVDTIKRLAILAKMTGADCYELGDSGFNEQIVPPENIMALSIAIRGRRHTYRRMAWSILR